MRYLTIVSIALLATVTLTTNICKATIEVPKVTYPTITKTDNNKHLTYPIKSYKKNKDTIIFSDWLRWVETCSKKYGIDKHFALAVAECESSNSHVRFRFGKMGRGTFYGPYGIRNIFLKKWDIDNVFVNTEVGIRALSRYGGDQKRALRHYNTSFNMAYYKRIKYLERKNREDKIFNLNPYEAQLLIYKLR
jgi:hypothetical protein